MPVGRRPRKTTRERLKATRATRKFTDRDDHKKLFDRVLTERSELLARSPAEDEVIPGKVLVFYGIGGVGKTRLRGEFEGMLRDRKPPLPFASVEFKGEMLGINKALFHLRCVLHSEFKVPFPSFDFAHIAWWSKANPGQPIPREEVSMLEKKGGDLGSFLSTAGDLFQKGGLFRDVAERLPFLGNTLVLGTYVWRIVKHLEKRYKGRGFDFSEIQGKAAHEIERMLPEYFAQDLADWIEESEPHAMPVLFLDNFELLTENRPEGDALLADEWVRNLIEGLPEVLWIITTRNYLDWRERYPDIWNKEVLEQHSLDRLAPAYAEKFLISCRIEDRKVREAIVVVSTIPLYLDIAVDTAVLIRANEGREPEVKDFSELPPEGKEELVERFMRYLTGPQATALKTLSVARFFTMELAKKLLDRFTKFEWQNFDREIARFSFVNEREGQPGIWELHPDVRGILSDRIGEEGRREIDRFLFEYYDDCLEGVEPTDLREEHIIALMEAFHHGKVVKLVEEFGDWFWERRDPFTDAARWHYEQALLSTDLLRLQEVTLGSEDVDVAATLNNLGTLSLDLGRQEKAGKYYQRSLAIKEKVLGQEHVDVANTLNNLGNLCNDLGRHEEAEKYYLRSQAIYEKVGGPEHVDAAMTLNNLGGMCSNLGRHEEAEKYYFRAVAIYEKECGPEHKNVAMTLNNLGLLCRNLGRYEEAEKYYFRALAIKEKVLGQEHVAVALTLNNLGLLCNDLGRYEEAEKYYLRSQAIYEKVWGPEHPDVALLLNNLGSLCSELGRNEEAERLCYRSLVIYEKVWGPEHQYVALPLNNLGRLCSKLWRHEEAEKYYFRALAIYEKVLGLEHMDVALTLNNLGLLCTALGRYEEAEKYYLGSQTIYEKVWGPEHPNVAMALNNLGCLYSENGRAEEAILLLERGVSISRAKSPLHKTAHLMDSLATAYREVGRFEEAERLYREALAIWRDKIGPVNPDQGETLFNLGVLLMRTGRAEEAEGLFLDCHRLIDRKIVTSESVARKLSGVWPSGQHE